MSERNLFLRGALILGIAGILSKLLGSVYTIFLQNIIGDRGIGLYQMAYPIYSTLLILSTAGFPVAVSKFVAEHIALGDYAGAKKVFRVSSVLLSITGVLFFLVLYFGAGQFADWFGDHEAVYAIKMIAPALLVVPLMSAVRGYFQGWQRMEPTATSQLVEQFVRVGTILALATLILQWGYGEAFAAAGAAFGAFTGGLAGFLTILVFMWTRRHYFRHDARFKNKVPAQPTWTVVKKLCWYALPVSLGALVVPLMNNVDVITVVNLLKKCGFSQAQATEMFGLLTGRAFKLMLLPTTFASAIGTALMPAISAAIALRDKRLVSYRMDMAMRLTMLVALPSSVGLALLAEPIDIMLFKNNEGTQAIIAIAAATLFSSIQLTSSAILQGVGKVYIPVRNLFIGALAKLGFNFLLVPILGINGAALATVISYLIATFLNMFALYKHTGVVFNLRTMLFRPLLATFFLAVAAYGVVEHLAPYFRQFTSDGRMIAALTAFTAMTTAGLVYVVALMVTGSVTRTDITAVPKFGPKLAGFFTRLGLLR
ncbi:polysaccharide biosynthesis protein [Tumebacillus sp. ITR2]|uniref:Polysaccharide biosynthesis protein n=1 Tax=Tumebacillus amylolyticus TaxID=2801339 RepID=A0ABS1JHD4_9BACL|nr:polysaccharide biosynthesis protein [Tumebacillus amylolyticus]MBL0389113.1 polysaccharide biosynthesis protein [Tumebacillus amylolyticus]